MSDFQAILLSEISKVQKNIDTRLFLCEPEDTYIHTYTYKKNTSELIRSISYGVSGWHWVETESGSNRERIGRPGYDTFQSTHCGTGLSFKTI